MKNLVLINGVTGAIGSACLAQFSRNPNNTIYGFARRARIYQFFLKNGAMPDATLVCSLGSDIIRGLRDLLSKVDRSQYERVVYVHALGVYPTEIDMDGVIRVSNDHDEDGIDDRVMTLSYEVFFGALDTLVQMELPTQAIIFGGLSDKHQPLVHQSWWKVMEKMKKRGMEVVGAQSGFGLTLLNVSSVMGPNDLMTRPFVFRDTDATAHCWLMPHEVAEAVERLTSGDRTGFQECELFHRAGYFKQGYYEGEGFTDRKKRELGIL
ncbi:MAG: hypothetical protein RL141_734 [Candidatus Parcubacteria bacterium]|jgi:hypothetical protein